MSIEQQHISLTDKVNNIETMLNKLLSSKEATTLNIAPPKRRGPFQGLSEAEKNKLINKRNKIALK
jgi:hypothetical protein